MWWPFCGKMIRLHSAEKPPPLPVCEEYLWILVIIPASATAAVLF